MLSLFFKHQSKCEVLPHSHNTAYAVRRRRALNVNGCATSSPIFCGCTSLRSIIQPQNIAYAETLYAIFLGRVVFGLSASNFTTLPASYASLALLTSSSGRWPLSLAPRVAQQVIGGSLICNSLSQIASLILVVFTPPVCYFTTTFGRNFTYHPTVS